MPTRDDKLFFWYFLDDRERELYLDIIYERMMKVRPGSQSYNRMKRLYDTIERDLDRSIFFKAMNGPTDRIKPGIVLSTDPDAVQDPYEDLEEDGNARNDR